MALEDVVPAACHFVVSKHLPCSLPFTWRSLTKASKETLSRVRMTAVWTGIKPRSYAQFWCAALQAQVTHRDTMGACLSQPVHAVKGLQVAAS